MSSPLRTRDLSGHRHAAEALGSPGTETSGGHCARVRIPRALGNRPNWPEPAKTVGPNRSGRTPSPSRPPSSWSSNSKRSSRPPRTPAFAAGRALRTRDLGGHRCVRGPTSPHGDERSQRQQVLSVSGVYGGCGVAVRLCQNPSCCGRPDE
jgi:hypothetical protein